MGKEYFESGPYGKQEYRIIERNYQILFEYGRRIFPDIFRRKLKMLDFGCAFGVGTFWLSNKINGIVVGVDISEYAIQKAKKLFLSNNIKFYCLDLSVIENINFLIRIHGKFDVIFSRDVIEHISKEKQKVIIKNFSTLLSDGGAVMIGTANGLNPYSYICDKTHIGLRTPWSYKRLFKEAGITIVKSFEKQWIPFLWRFRKDRSLMEIDLPLFGFMVYIFAKKADAN